MTVGSTGEKVLGPEQIFGPPRENKQFLHWCCTARGHVPAETLTRQGKYDDEAEAMRR